MTAPEPTQPLTEGDIAKIRARVDARSGPDRYDFTIDGIGYDGHWAHDSHRLLAEVDRLRTQLRNERERLNEALAENVRRLGEITGLRTELRGCRNLGVEYERLRVENIELTTKAAQAWSEGHSAALAAGCDSEDQFRANLGVLLVAEEHRCQLAINEAPADPHLNGRLVGLQRARDIVTGEAFAPDQSGEGQANG